MASNIPLFYKLDLHSTLAEQLKHMEDEITRYPANELLNAGPEQLLDYFEATYRIDVPRLDEESMLFDQKEVQIDISNDWTRIVIDRSRPAYAAGTQYDFLIPFDGDAPLFNMRASTFSSAPPRALIRDGYLVLSYSRLDHNADALKSDFNRDLQAVRQCLQWLTQDAEPFNRSLRGKADQLITARKNRILASQNVAKIIGLPIRRRDDLPSTYATSTVRRKSSPIRPIASSDPHVLEPTLPDVEYEFILEVMRSCVAVMERSPHAFAQMHEPEIRDQLLVQLNGHYHGRATGETFNSNGKTDILIRDQNKNIFIAECKFWGGPKALIKAVDQLLGYATWRDSKLAIVILYRGPKFGEMLDKIPTSMKSHPNFVKALPQSHETTWQYIVRHQDDANRELKLSVLAFHVPA